MSFVAEQTAGSVLRALCEHGATNLFFHDLATAPGHRALTASLPGWQRYAGRALVLAARGDVVCVRDPVEPVYLDYLAELSIGPQREDILAVPAPETGEESEDLAARTLRNAGFFARLRQTLTGRGRILIHPFFPAESHFKLAGLLRDELQVPVRVYAPPLGVARRMSAKDVVRKAAVALGVPMARGEVVRLEKETAGPAISRLRDVVARVLHHTGAAIVRGAQSAGGSALAVFADAGSETEQRLAEMLERTGQKVWLVDAFYEARCSANVQFCTDPNGHRVEYITSTDQRFRGVLAYDGNAWPSRAMLLTQMVDGARRMGRWFLESGGLGPAGLDCVEFRNPQTGNLEWIMAEMNPRINASAYPYALVERINQRRQDRSREPVGGFVSAGLRTDAEDFSAFRDRFKDLFYDERSGTGMVPFFVGALAFGKVDAAFLAGSRGEAEVLCREAVRRTETASAGGG